MIENSLSYLNFNVLYKKYAQMHKIQKCLKI